MKFVLNLGRLEVLTAATTKTKIAAVSGTNGTAPKFVDVQLVPHGFHIILYSQGGQDVS